MMLTTSCKARTKQLLPVTWLMPTWSVLITQGSLTQEADLQMMRKLHSPSCAIHRRSGGVALWGTRIVDVGKRRRRLER